MDKLLALIGLGQSLYGPWLFRKLISGVVVIAVLAIVTAMLAGTLLIGAFYAIYLGLLHNGVDPQSALFILVTLVILVFVIILLATIVYVGRLREMPHRILEEKSPLIFHTGSVVDSFLSGFRQGGNKS